MYSAFVQGTWLSNLILIFSFLIIAQFLCNLCSSPISHELSDLLLGHLSPKSRECVLKHDGDLSSIQCLQFVLRWNYELCCICHFFVSGFLLETLIPSALTCSTGR